MFFWRAQKSDFNSAEIRIMADAVRALSIDQVQAAQSGHPGAPLGMADIITTIFANHLRFNPNNPEWPVRDRFVLSAGHASAMLYATLHLAGYDVLMNDLKKFRQLGARTQGHPEYGAMPGIETSTGPLGQGFANAIGMAMAAKIKKTNSRVYCLCSDGDLMEGVSSEAASFAGYYKLNNLIVFWDNNGISIDGNVAMSDDIPARFLSAGWATIEINGMNPDEINRAINIAKKMRKPVFIACKTTIGYLSEHAGTAAVHGSPLSDADATEVLNKLRPGGKPFTVAKSATTLWARLRNIKISTPTISEPVSPIEINFDTLSTEILTNIAKSKKPESTRTMFGRAIKIAMEQMPGILIGGSADLAASTHARPDIATDITPENYHGNYIHYGVREHAMSAIMNGLSLSGLRPCGSTFLIFSDYMRPAIRLSALMNQPVIYVFTHDSIALGEDGVTHQPIEQLASLRLIPNLHVMRPANAIEVAMSMELALRRKDGPTAIVLSRQDFPIVPDGAAPDEMEKGGYILRDAVSKKPTITLMATGSEVALALAVQKTLYSRGVSAAVVSMPAPEIFRLQSDEYRRKILRGRVIVIEAGTTRAWHEFADEVIGVDTFGAGGKGADVYKYFGFDATIIAKKIEAKLKPTK